MVILLRILFLLISILIPDANAQGEDTPHSKQNKLCKNIREDFVVGSKAGTNPDFRTPQKEEILSNHLGNTKQIQVAGETVFFDTGLFDLNQMFLARDSKSKLQSRWVKLEDMMSNGRAGISYKAGLEIKELLEKHNLSIGVSPLKLSKELKQEIFKIQRKYTYELHHTTQKMYGFGIMLALKGYHMGGADAFLVENKENSDFNIIAAHLSPTSSKKLKLELDPGQRIYKNALHTNKGKSQVDRKAFDKQREDIWKELCVEYKNHSEANSSPTNLFGSGLLD